MGGEEPRRLDAPMAARLALLFLFVGRVSAQLSCTGEEQLVANLRWVREVCEQQGEAFPEGDVLGWESHLI